MKLTKKIFGNIVMDSIKNNTFPNWDDYDITKKDALLLMKKWCKVVELMDGPATDLETVVNDWDKTWNEIVGG